MFQGRVALVDFNPYSAVTDALLFSWEELKFGPAKLSRFLKEAKVPVVV